MRDRGFAPRGQAFPHRRHPSPRQRRTRARSRECFQSPSPRQTRGRSRQSDPRGLRRVRHPGGRYRRRLGRQKLPRRGVPLLWRADRGPIRSRARHLRRQSSFPSIPRSRSSLRNNDSREGRVTLSGGQPRLAFGSGPTTGWPHFWAMKKGEVTKLCCEIRRCLERREISAQNYLFIQLRPFNSFKSPENSFAANPETNY